MSRDLRQRSRHQVQSDVAQRAAVAAFTSAAVTVAPPGAGAAGAGRVVCADFLASCISCGWSVGCATAATCSC